MLVNENRCKYISCVSVLKCTAGNLTLLDKEASDRAQL